jgi:hypothetical protein
MSRYKVGDRVQEAPPSLRTHRGKISELYTSEKYGLVAIVIWDGEDGGEDFRISELMPA